MIQEFSAGALRKLAESQKQARLTPITAPLRIFDEALMWGYICEDPSSAPTEQGTDAKRRPDFILVEYQKMCQAPRDWVKKGRKGKSRDMRELLRDYICNYCKGWNAPWNRSTKSLEMKSEKQVFRLPDGTGTSVLDRKLC